MASAKADLVTLCKSIDLIKELKVFQEIADEGKKELETIGQDFMQWMETTKLQLQATHKDNKTTNQVPLLPQTPTMKRKLRKRKIPVVEDEEKENTAITRPRRAASQAANSKFYNQLHLPTKMRRPSSPQPSSSSLAPEQPTQKRPRVAKKLRINEDHEEMDSDDDTVSLASIASIKGGRKLQAQKDRATSQADETQDESTKSKKPMKTRGRKKAAAAKDLTEYMQTDEASHRLSTEFVVSSIAEPTSSRLRKFHEEPSSSVKKDSPTSVEPSTSEARPKRGKKQKKIPSSLTYDNHDSDAGEGVQDMEISPAVVVEEITSTVTHTKVIEVHLERLPEFVTSTVVVTPAGTLIPEDNKRTPTRKSRSLRSGEQLTPDDMELTMAMSAVKTPVQAKKAAAPQPSTSYELAALTPRLKGIVKERVIAVEKSLKKEEPISKFQNAKRQQATSSKVDASPLNLTGDLFESAESSPEREPSPKKKKRSSERRTSRPSLKTVIKTKRSISTPAEGHLIVKLFDGNTMHKRSMSQDELPSSGQGKTSTLGRSRVLTGMRTFIKPSARELSQAALLEEEKRRKLEEAQRLAERAQEAARKKEEQIRLKKEQKKKENEEKRVRALLAQEAKAREQEEAARLEKEKNERQAALQRAREEKELKEKEQRREYRKQKQQEREQRRKEEEAARVAKAKEVANAAAIEMKTREEERKVEATKGGWAAPPAKLHTSKTTVKQIASAAVKNVFNETFEMPKPYTAGQKAPVQNSSKLNLSAAVASTSSSNSYAMTPSRDEIPPLPPKNPDDYGVDDVSEDDPSDDDEKPKKIIPLWARNPRKNFSIVCSDFIRIGVRNRLFGTKVFKPSAEELFGAYARPVHRRSSAVWNTPPNLHHQSLCQSFMSD